MPNVLMVDDDAAIRTVLRLKLEREGYRVFEAANAADALSLLDTVEQLDVAIVDIHMPGMSGLEVLRHTRATRPNATVIAMSGVSEGLDMAIGQVERIYVLDKPFTLEQLGAVLPRKSSG